jgi:ferredoxin
MSTHPHSHPDPDCEVLADALGDGADPHVQQLPPPPASRGSRLLARLERLFVFADAWLERVLPRSFNPLAQLGPLANAALVIATASGVLLLVWYSPSVHHAWSSLHELGPRSLGGIVRSVHRYSSDLAMLFILMHALRTFAGRKFAGPRWLAWASGVGLIALVWFIGWTGYWLVWDVRAQWVALDSMRALDVLPIFGEPMGRLFTADHTVPSLLFFVVFFLHMLLPLMIAAALCLHLARLSRSKLMPDRRVTIWVTVATFAAALILPATNAAPAAMAIKPEVFTMDWWYLWPLAISSRLSGGGLWLAAGFTLLGLMSLPWWLGRRRERATYQATVNTSRCFSCTQCSQDCPFGAITMVPRTDGRPWPSQAQVDPDRCVGCGVCTGSCDTQAIGMAWFDARAVTRDLQDFVIGEVKAGRTPAVALVCAQADGGWDNFRAAIWRARLPGYEVRPVPSAGWVEPKVLEGLIAKGARAVLVVSTVNAEPFTREGDRWLALRLSGDRDPVFRPSRADPRKVAYVRYDPSRPAELTAAASALLESQSPVAPTAPAIWKQWLGGLGVTAVILAVTLLLSDTSFRHPQAAHPEFVLTFRAYGEWLDATTVAARDDRPAHMRAATRASRERSPVVITVEINGEAQQHIVRPKGLRSDGASVGELRVPLAPGRHQVALTVATRTGEADAPQHHWTGTVEAVAGRIFVVAFEPGDGFRVEP